MIKKLQINSFNFFKKQNKVFFSPIFKYFYHLILFANKDSEFIISWKQYQPEFSFHLNTKEELLFQNSQNKN